MSWCQYDHSTHHHVGGILSSLLFISLPAIYPPPNMTADQYFRYIPANLARLKGGISSMM